MSLITNYFSTYFTKKVSTFMIINASHERYSEEFMFTIQLSRRFFQEVSINIYRIF